jgi:hypothetical protein
MRLTKATVRKKAKVRRRIKLRLAKFKARYHPERYLGYRTVRRMSTDWKGIYGTCSTPDAPDDHATDAMSEVKMQTDTNRFMSSTIRRLPTVTNP